MKTWHYNRTDTMPISYTIMIRSAGAKFPSEYSRQQSDSEDTVCETDVAQ